MKIPCIAALIVPLLASTALADAIDGDWCSPDGAHVRIDGPSIELGNGAKIMGKYGRHDFAYIAPQGDTEAGAEIYFRLRSDDEMRRVRDPMAMPDHADIWKRCETISLAPLRDRSPDLRGAG